MFLSGARDAWFVVGVPVYFQAVLSDGTAEGRREAFFLIGGFLALWIMAHGAACLNRSRTRAAPTSTNISTNALPPN